MIEANESDEELELQDLGDATEETRQIFPYPRFPDSQFGFGWGAG